MDRHNRGSLYGYKAGIYKINLEHFGVVVAFDINAHLDGCFGDLGCYIKFDAMFDKAFSLEFR